MVIHTGIIHNSINEQRMNFRLKSIGLFLITTVIISCTPEVNEYEEAGEYASINPDYSGLIIPPDIAPLNFVINEKADRYLLKLHSGDGIAESFYFRTNMIKFPKKEWKKILDQCRGKELYIEIYAKNNGKWTKFKVVTDTIAKESIDDYLVYRLIEPGFKGWKKMGIYQRSLGSFSEKPVFTNTLSKGNCMNCHSFCMNNNDQMLFHMRGKIAGTVILNKGELNWVNTKTEKAISAGVYPQWHPGGKYVAFSVNQIIQKFHAVKDKRIEVLDTASDVVVYDIKNNKIISDKSLSSPGRFETFPSWSPDGNTLYFCSAAVRPPEKYNEIRYDLMKTSFDPEGKLSGDIDTIISSSETGSSISFPRISPDGKFLLFTISPYGNFSIWHRESDLYLMDLSTSEISRPEINSNFAESYHSWSSNGRWVVFSSRRDDGLYTRPYIAYFDTTGKFHKPFILPQRNPVFYHSFLKSYNIPEFVRSQVMLNKRELYRLIRSKPVNATSDQ